jgi:flagellar basal body-associated protein FliL
VEPRATRVDLQRPGPTVEHKPFVVANTDATPGEQHAIKLTIAIELSPAQKKSDLEPFVPRIRDTTIVYLRFLTFQDVASADSTRRIALDLIDRIHVVGAQVARAVLIHDLVTQ